MWIKMFGVVIFLTISSRVDNIDKYVICIIIYMSSKIILHILDGDNKLKINSDNYNNSLYKICRIIGRNG